MLPATLYDLWDYKVRNEIIYMGWLQGFVCSIMHYGLKGAFIWLIGVISTVLLLWLFFYLKVIGAGDIKLFSVLGGFYGMGFAFNIIILSLFVGSFLSFIHVIRFKNLFIRLRYLVKYISNWRSNEKLPPYYQRKRDGEEAVIPFTLAISISVVIERIRMGGGF